MTLVEISEREVIKAARAWKAWRIVTEAGGSVAQPEISLAEAVILLEERERIEQSITYPPMVEGQCHWKVGGNIVAPIPECQHVATTNHEGNNA